MKDEPRVAVIAAALACLSVRVYVGLHLLLQLICLPVCLSASLLVCLPVCPSIRLIKRHSCIRYRQTTSLIFQFPAAPAWGFGVLFNIFFIVALSILRASLLLLLSVSSMFFYAVLCHFLLA